MNALVIINKEESHVITIRRQKENTTKRRKEGEIDIKKQRVMKAVILTMGEISQKRESVRK